MIAANVSEVDVPVEGLRGHFGDSTHNDRSTRFQLALRLCNSACRSAGRTLGGRGFRIIHIFPSRNLRNLDSSADHVARAVLAFSFCGSLGLSHEFVPGTHQAFASIPIVEDASTRRDCAKSIPGDASLFAERLGAPQDCCVINFCPLMLQGLRPRCSVVSAPTGTAMGGGVIGGALIDPT